MASRFCVFDGTARWFVRNENRFRFDLGWFVGGRRHLLGSNDASHHAGLQACMFPFSIFDCDHNKRKLDIGDYLLSQFQPRSLVTLCEKRVHPVRQSPCAQ